MNRKNDFLSYFAETLSSESPEIIVLFDREMNQISGCICSSKILGYKPDEILDIRLKEIILSEDFSEFTKKFESLKNGIPDKTVKFSIRLKTKSGEPESLEVSGKNSLHNHFLNGIIFRLQIKDDRILERRIMVAQKSLLESVARQLPIDQILNDIAEFAESLISGDAYCSVLIANREKKTLQKGGSKKLPAKFVEMLDGVSIGANQISSGVCAFLKKQIISPDISTDPIWTKYKNWMITEYGFHSCWSTPVTNGNNEILGTVDLYFKQTRTPQKSDFDLMDAAAYIAEIAIERHLNEQDSFVGKKELSQTESRYKYLVENLPEIIFITDYHLKMLYANPSLSIQTGFGIDDFQDSKQVKNFIYEADIETVSQFIKSFISSDKNLSAIIECRFVDKSGGLQWFSSIISKIEFNGQPSLQIIARNITELKNAEELIVEREVLFSALFDGAKDAVLISDIGTGKILDANQSSQTLFDKKRAEIVGHHHNEFYPANYQKSVSNLLENYIIEEQIPPFYSEIATRGNKKTSVEINSSVIILPNGKKVLQGMFRDYSDKNRLELMNKVQYSISKAINSSKNIDELLSLIHKSLGLIIDTTNFFIALHDKRRHIITFPYFIDMMDEDSSLLSIDNDRSLTVRVIKSGQPLLLRQQFFIDRAKNESTDLLGSTPKIWLGVPLSIKGEVIGAVTVQSYDNPELYSEDDISILMPITEQIAIAIDRKQKEEELRESGERYRAFIEQSSEGVYRIELDNPIPVKLEIGEKIKQYYQNAYLAECNKVILDMYGFNSMEEAIGVRISTFLISDDPKNTEYLKKCFNNNGRITDHESHQKDRNGNDKYFLNNLIMIEENGFFVRAWGTLRDVTNKKLYDKALSEERERLAVTLRSIADGVITTNIDGKIILMNRVSELITGWNQSEWYGNSIDTVFTVLHERNRTAFGITKMISENTFNLLPNTAIHISKENRERLIEVSASPIKDNQNRTAGIVIVFRDITDKKKMEDEILRSRKIESVGVLAGGIAHDFNNILTAVIGNISLSKMMSEADSKIYNLLDSAEKASSRAISLTQQLLTFSKGGAPIRKAASIKELLVESATFATRGTSVSPKFRIPDNTWTVEIDEGQINQVINNLVINAVQAMPDGGVINIQAENILSQNENNQLLLPKSKYVKISVSDSGVGIPESNLAKIFDPYFSTKKKGSGLGLATSFSIINRHDGIMTVESTVGSGTTFVIYLPASEKETEIEAQKSAVPLKNGAGKILVMDDEEIILTLVENILSQKGYEVICVKDGKDAVTEYHKEMKSGSRFRAVIMDLTIPGGMGGKDAVRKILKLDQEATVIVSSGYSNDPIMSNYTEYGFKGVLIKPYQAKNLLEVLGDFLN